MDMEGTFSEISNHVDETLKTQKSLVDTLKMKVDSMDNTYDKRLSNLEAVVTPLLSGDGQNVEELAKGVRELLQPELKKSIIEFKKEVDRSISSLTEQIQSQSQLDAPEHR